MKKETIIRIHDSLADDYEHQGWTVKRSIYETIYYQITPQGDCVIQPVEITLRKELKSASINVEKVDNGFFIRGTVEPNADETNPQYQRLVVLRKDEVARAVESMLEKTEFKTITLNYPADFYIPDTYYDELVNAWDDASNGDRAQLASAF